MRATRWLLWLAVLACSSTMMGAEPDAAERLKEVQAKIAATPHDAQLHFEQARCLMELGKYDEGYGSAVTGRELLGDQAEFLRFTPLEEIDLEKVRIEVRMNLGPRERRPPQTGIGLPLTFRVWSRSVFPELLDTIDFEIGYLDGKPNTAALGQEQSSGVHANFGVLDPASTYDVVRNRAIELIKQRTARMSIQPQTTKKYLNLELPGRTQFAPIVLAATPEKAIVARVADVDGKRDIQVLQGSGEHWDFLGEQGRALTGEDGNFLTDAQQGPDGRLWVLVRYTPPSNPKKGWWAFLYCYEIGRWSMADPPEGHVATALSNHGLVFLASSDPVHHQSFFNKKDRTALKDIQQLLQWHDGTWRSHPAERLLNEDGWLAWTAGEAWTIGTLSRGGKTVVHGHRITGARSADITGPHPLLTLDGSYELRHVDLSRDHRLAMMFKEVAEPDRPEKDKPYVGWIIDVTRPDKPTVEPLPAPPASWLDHLCWSPKGELVATDCDPSHFRVFALRDGKWTTVGEASQERAQGFIFRPRLTFRSDGVPMMTWRDFFPH